MKFGLNLKKYFILVKKYNCFYKKILKKTGFLKKVLYFFIKFDKMKNNKFFKTFICSESELSINL